MNFVTVQETFAKGSQYTYMIVPLGIAIVVVVLSVVLTNTIKVLMSQKWVATVNNTQTSESFSGDIENVQETEGDEEEEAEMQRIAKMYEDI